MGDGFDMFVEPRRLLFLYKWDPEVHSRSRDPGWTPHPRMPGEPVPDITRRGLGPVRGQSLKSRSMENAMAPPGTSVLISVRNGPKPDTQAARRYLRIVIAAQVCKRRNLNALHYRRERKLRQYRSVL